MVKVERFTDWQTVVVRTYGGVPKKVRAIGCGPGFVAVTTRDYRSAIGFPESLVYEFDEDSYTHLNSVVSTADATQVEDAWQSMRVFKA